MNRLAFLKSLALLPFIPLAKRLPAAAPKIDVMVGATPLPDPGAPYYYRADSRGIYRLLNNCGKVVDTEPLNLDRIFEQLYALKKRRDSATEVYDGFRVWTT